MTKSKNAYQQLQKIEPLFHLLLWIIVLLYPYFKYALKDGGYNLPLIHEINALLFKMTISYFLYFWYFPQKNKLTTLPLVITAILLNISIYEYFDQFFHDCEHHIIIHLFNNLLTNIGFGILFYALYLLKNILKKQVELELLIQEKQKAEIKAWKAQVNPHFLFNTLNTVYANALKNDIKTPDLILKLSDSFRYLFHEGQSDQVTLSKEIQHIEDYIHLQKERLANKVIVEYDCTIEHPKKHIAPLLLMSFIENAFKYTSILKGNGHRIQFHIKQDQDQLQFFSKNPFHPKALNEIDHSWKESGIGIESTKKRLQLIYPNQHDLKIFQEKDLFIVKLNIQL